MRSVFTLTGSAPAWYGLGAENWTVVVSELVSNVLLVSPGEALELLQRGYTYVDVRSELEFALGRPPRARNVPWQRAEGDRLVANSDFASVMQSSFTSTEPLIIGCRSGSRSRAAIECLHELGFTELAQLRHGFAGARDAFGRHLPGWRDSGLAVESGEPCAELSYAGLCARQRTAAR
jgi:rhodanese-related sulfurtransferase